MQNQSFITNIHIKSFRDINELDVFFSLTEKKHLIITGKNGCGKTGFLNLLFEYIEKHSISHYSPLKDVFEERHKKYNALRVRAASNIDTNDRNNARTEIKLYRDHYETSKSELDYFVSNSNVLIEVNNPSSSKWLIKYFKSNRDVSLKDLPFQGIILSEPFKPTSIVEKSIGTISQYLTNLRAKQAFAYESGDTKVYDKIKDWWNRFEKKIGLLLDDEGLKLHFDNDTFNLSLIKSDGWIQDFSTLSHGYSALTGILAELIMSIGINGNDTPGLVLIDEIETHLHVDLQKKTFIAHEGDVDLKFDWENLFLSCVHCNNLKSNKFSNILNCTSEEYNVDERIKCACMPFRSIMIEPLDEDAKTIETVKLLQNVFNGTTPLKKIESDNLMKAVWIELNELTNLILEYYRSEGEESREYLTTLLRNRLSRASAYASIKRWFIKESPALGELTILFD